MTLSEKREYQRKWRHNNSDKCKASQKRYHETHQEQMKLYRERTKEMKANSFRLRTYGLSPDNYINLLVKQNQACAICRCVKELEVDHSHQTSKVRGLLCQECNLGLGKFKDSVALLKSALEYLNEERNHR